MRESKLQGKITFVDYFQYYSFLDDENKNKNVYNYNIVAKCSKCESCNFHGFEIIKNDEIKDFRSKSIFETEFESMKKSHEDTDYFFRACAKCFCDYVLTL